MPPACCPVTTPAPNSGPIPHQILPQLWPNCAPSEAWWWWARSCRCRSGARSRLACMHACLLTAGAAHAPLHHPAVRLCCHDAFRSKVFGTRQLHSFSGKQGVGLLARRSGMREAAPPPKNAGWQPPTHASVQTAKHACCNGGYIVVSTALQAPPDGGHPVRGATAVCIRCVHALGRSSVRRCAASRGGAVLKHEWDMPAVHAARCCTLLDCGSAHAAQDRRSPRLGRL